MMFLLNLIEKVDEMASKAVKSGNNMTQLEKLGTYCSGIGKKDIYRVPLSQQDKVSINNVLSKHITKDLFEKSKTGRRKYEFWKKHPVRAISYLDEVCRKQSMHFMLKSKRTSSPIIKILLRIKGVNKMEQINKEIEEQNKASAEHIKQHKHDTQMVKAEFKLAGNFIEQIKVRSQALAEEDVYKRELVKAAKQKGWLGVTIEEIDLDITTSYRKLSEQVESVDEFKKDDIELLKMMQSIRRDKVDIHKFQVNTQIQLAKLEETKKLRERISGKVNEIKIDNMDLE